MINEILETFRGESAETIDALMRELARLRTGRASVNILDSIRVNYYGQNSALTGVASLSVPDARTIAIKPWDKSMIQPIERAIMESDIGINPQNDGEIIRLPVPPLTEDRRKEMVKQVKSRGEDHKVSIRNSRRDAKEMMEGLQKDGEISEDELKRGLDDLQKATDGATAKIDEYVSKKETEVLTV